MKFINAILTIAIAPFVLAAPTASDTFSVQAFSSPFCTTTSDLIQTVAATSVEYGHCFSLAQPMSSFNVLMNGACSITTFFFDTACADASGSDVGSPWAAGCQTFAAGLMGSFKVTC